MHVLLSIKPEYVEKIFQGTKKYEFRKSIFRRNVKKVCIYSTSPVKKIVGRFTIVRITAGHPVRLWEKYWAYAGIEKKDFFAYFQAREKGFCIEIGEVEIFKEPLDPHSLIPGFIAPQSFKYFDPNVQYISDL